MMEDAVWGNPNQNVNTSHEVLDSNSTLKTYQRKRNRNVWGKTKTVLNVFLNTAAVMGWVLVFVLLFDALFLNARLIEYLLIGY